MSLCSSSIGTRRGSRCARSRPSIGRGGSLRSSFATSKWSATTSSDASARAGTLEAVLDFGAVGLAADALGGSERVLEMAVEYSKTREQFGRPIGSFQAIKHMAAEMVADSRARSLAPVVCRSCSRCPAARREPRRIDGESRALRNLSSIVESRGADARRYRLHVGARSAFLVQARQMERARLRRSIVSSRARCRSLRFLRRGVFLRSADSCQTDAGAAIRSQTRVRARTQGDRAARFNDRGRRAALN